MQGVSVYRILYLQRDKINSTKINSTSTHRKVYWYSKSFIYKDTILQRKNFTSVIISDKSIIKAFKLTT